MPIPQPRNPLFSCQDFFLQFAVCESGPLLALLVLKQPQIEGHGDHVFVRWIKGLIMLNVFFRTRCPRPAIVGFQHADHGGAGQALALQASRQLADVLA